ncbi:transforming acidic coiled-coil-containing protein 2 isoform X2 [Monomorium pharaonis]|uniref:transforming acidic coiled-coil-containing protein 2 isoform X2 n=1 Tax=Monomorium pharaonis TaxID=307658 RepID=UPI00063F9F29|nr:transforming acidic coiled-coil-containing protein 2 isoform X2 [Monomorium pharaonis]
MEYIHKLLYRATSPRTSPSPTLTSDNDSPVTVAKTAEHEVKVRFAREFADVGSVTENLCLAPESLSSASSFHSLSSTLSTKSSSGICPDSTPETPDDVADTSYVNSNIPGVEDLILACADIHLGSERDCQDLSQDQTFASAVDETPYPTSDCSLNEDLLDNTDNETQVIQTSPELHETTSLNQTHILESSGNTLPIEDSHIVISSPFVEEVLQTQVIETNPQLHKATSLNQTHILELSGNTLPIEDSHIVISSPSPVEEILQTQVIETNPQLHEATSLNQTHILESSGNTLPIKDLHIVISSPSLVTEVLQTEDLTNKQIPLQESDNIVSELETCDIASNIVKNILPISNVNNNQLNITTTISSNNTTFNVIAPSEEQAIKNNCSAETLPLEDTQVCPTEISVPSISSLAQYTDLSLPNISSVSSPLEDTDNKTRETNTKALLELKQDTSTVLLPSNNFDQKLCVLSQTIVDNSVVQAEKDDVIREPGFSQLNNHIVLDKKDNIQLLDEISIIESKSLEIKENLQTSVDKKDLEVDNSVALNAIQNLPEKEIAIYNETCIIKEQCNSETVENEKQIVESTDITSVVKKETPVEDLDSTLTLQEADIIFTPDEEQYEEFKPQRQSTTLSGINEQLYFDELKSTVEKVTNELLDPLLEFTDDQFVSATPEIFQDPSTFDFLLARSNPTHTNRLRAESLYVKFDPLVSNTSMLPQGNAQTINEEKNGKNESPPPDVGTPKHNPAIAAIDRLLFYSPLPNATVQKLEEAQEKNEQPIEEPKSDAPLIDHIDMSKELELVRTTVLQLEEELEKQKKEHETELERQKAVFQEKVNKLQAQISQEIKTRTQMKVVLEEYEKSISKLVTAREKDRTSFEQDKAKLQEELQAANHHLTNTEAAFNDVHQKYERLKGVVSVYKNNESVLKESIQENVETIKTLETRYDQLKEHAMTQLEKANLELDGIRKQNEAETVKLHAMIRKAELKSNSLTELVEQKTKENKELAKILDEVIARVGHGNSE